MRIVGKCEGRRSALSTVPAPDPSAWAPLTGSGNPLGVQLPRMGIDPKNICGTLSHGRLHAEV
jgi:hypothetical protein